MSVRSTWEFSVLSLQFFYKSKFIPKFERIKDFAQELSWHWEIPFPCLIAFVPTHPLLTTCVGQTQGPHARSWHGRLNLCRETPVLTPSATALQTTPVHIWKKSFVDQWMWNKNWLWKKHKGQCRHLPSLNLPGCYWKDRETLALFLLIFKNSPMQPDCLLGFLNTLQTESPDRKCVSPELNESS